MKHLYQKKRFILAGVVICIVTLLAVGTFLSTQKKYTLEKNSANVSPTPTNAVFCTKTQIETSAWDLYTCSSYSLQLPHGWSTDSVEFINYDMSKAEGREYNSTLDKGKLKFGVILFPTSQDINTVVLEKAKANEEKILTSTPRIINGYSAIEISSVSSGHPNEPGKTIYIQNPSKNIIAKISFIFGFNNQSDFENQILSTFQFDK